MSNSFEIPVVLIIFKRKLKSLRIIERISQIRPKKLYILGDAGRNAEECQIVEDCRKAVEAAVSWDCELIKNYAVENRGVYKNIGEGAKWVFEREKYAIFLEDDNLPEVTFFRYCEELLKKYENEAKVLWICGTNYLGEYSPDNGASYMFTQHLLPCGWASWADKFLPTYDGMLTTLDDIEHRNQFRCTYQDKRLYRQQMYSICRTKYLLSKNLNKSSWDYQMLFSMRSKDLFGISPSKNQIKNIGVDAASEHGGNSMEIEMTKRFCGMNSFSLSFPLRHPDKIAINQTYEEQISEIILMPCMDRIKRSVATILKPLLRLNRYDSMAEYLRKIRK